MSLRNRFILPLAFLGIAALVGCGSGSNAVVTPPGGGFSNSDLNGTYVFSSTGVDFTGIYLTVVGSFQANGSGVITGGTIDVNGLDVGPSSTPITSGTYNITADGRGQVKVSSDTSLADSITFDFVLSSSSHGLVTEFDGSGSGSGTLDLQGTQSLQNSYSFGFAGASASGQNEIPFAMAGSFTLNGSGSITSGVADINDDGTSAGGTNGLTLTGTVAAGSPGFASFTTTAGTFNFDVYVIDSTHLKFIETDSLPVIAGDAYIQQSSIPAGTLAYTMAGADVAFNPLVLGGFMASDGGGNISAGFEEYNDAGILPSSPITGFTGSYTPFVGGRSVLTLNSIYNGENGILSPTVQFAAYPSSGGLELLEIDGAGFTSGAAYAQTGTSFAASQGYGLNLTAINAGGFEEDDIAEFTLTGSNFKGLADINDEGDSGVSGATFTGTFTPDAAVPGHGSASSNQFNFNYYVVDASTILMLETDNNQVGLGSFLLQSSTQGNAGKAFIPQSAMARLKPSGRSRSGQWTTAKKKLGN
jgi:hypothetical protein